MSRISNGVKIYYVVIKLAKCERIGDFKMLTFAQALYRVYGPRVLE